MNDWQDRLVKEYIDADDIMAICFSGALWLTTLILCIGIWFA